MTSNRCLLCLQQVVASTGQESDEKRKIKIPTLFELLVPSSSYHGQFDDDEICGFCRDCYPVVVEVGDIRQQISILECQVERKIGQIKDKISNYSLDSGGDRIMEIRNLILRMTGAADLIDQNNDDLAQNVVLVKEEHELDHGDDQFFDDYNYELAHTEEDSNDPLGDLEDKDYDSEFCITPSTQKRSKLGTKEQGRKSINKKSPSFRRSAKRKTSPSPPEVLAKRIKREPRPILERTRCSSRVKKPVLPPPPEVKKILKVSLERLVPTKKPKKPRPYKCTSCTATFAASHSLTRHLGLAHSGIPCSLCDATFSTRNEMDDHVKLAHDNGSPFQCPICGRKCNRPSRLAEHLFMRHENGEKKFPCTKCDRNFALEQNFQRHVKLHDLDEVKPLVCVVCDSRYENEDLLKIHMERHEPRYRCDQCGKKSHTKNNLERHMRSHTNERPEKCPHCDVPFRDKLTLERHIGREHTKNQHICHLCGKGFYLPVDLQSHIDRHEGKRKVKCDACGEIVVDKAALQVHQVKVHGADPVVCDECGARFFSSANLKRHKQTHAGIKLFKCDICDTRFLREPSLRVHMRSHSNERPFPCPHCEKAFKTMSQKNEHVKRIHTNCVIPTPHKCSHCEKAFPRKSYLEGHIRSAHTGERPFICEECGTGFVLKTMLNQHLKVSHGLGVTTEKKERLPRAKRGEMVEITEKQDSETLNQSEVLVKLFHR